MKTSRVYHYVQFLVLFVINKSILSVHGNRFPVAINPSSPILDDHNPYRHEQVLDPEGKYRLEWLVDWKLERVFFNCTVETLGFIEFGLSKVTQMSRRDVIIGGVDALGRPYFSDRHVIGNNVPIEDKRQDWILHGASQTLTQTHLSFSRAFDTCDKQDIPINDDTFLLVWGYGLTDYLTGYATRTQGYVPQHILDPDLTPRVVHESLRSGESPNLPDDIKIWSLRNSNFRIPAKRTTYWGRIHKLSLSGKHHIIGFAYRINNETELNMHHALLYRCMAPNAESIYERYVNHPGEEVYTQSMQLGEIPFQSCIELKIGHAIRGRPLFFPDVMGIPIGEKARNEYYLLVTHYDNPELRADLVSENQLDVYYTSLIRPNDGGILSLGQHIPGSPSILIPPNSVNHKIYGHCSSTCTLKMLPKNGIKFVSTLLHTHNAGRILALEHFRNHKQLPNILADSSYIATYQPSRLLQKEVAILPGDHVIMRCNYDTTYTNQTTIGGFAVPQEMCKSFIVYYGPLEYPICRSELIDPAYTARYFAGTTNVTWNQPRLEFEATAPPHVAGMVLTEISDNLVNWNDQLRAQLKKDHLLHPQVDICPSFQEIEASARTGIQPPPTFVTYPVEADKYLPPEQCSLV